jgi:two-component system, cell cycle sensor histidine kinase and response regulator CckA
MPAENLKKATILVADDESCLLRLTHSFLTQHGYDVLTGLGPEDALQIAERHAGSIDLLLTDVRMPNMDGPTLLQKVREVHPKSKVIFMTAYSPEEMNKMIPDETIVQKPFELGHLCEVVRSTLEQQ